MKTSDFDYELPEELIAQTPVEPRDHSRLMVVHRATGEREDKHFYDIIDYLNPNDALVINETKVIPARLLGEKEDTGVPVEVLLLRRKNQTDWEALVRPGRRLKPGTTCVFGGGLLKCEILESVPEIGGRIVRFHYEGVFEELLDRLGEMPMLTAFDTYLTDDPNVSEYHQAELPAGTKLTALSHPDNQWAYVYVEATVDGKITRGFVPQRDVVFDDVELPDEEAKLVGSWQMEAGGEFWDNYLRLDADGKFYGSDCDGAQPYHCTWSVVQTPADSNLYWRGDIPTIVFRCVNGTVYRYGVGVSESADYEVTEGDYCRSMSLITCEGGTGYVSYGVYGEGGGIITDENGKLILKELNVTNELNWGAYWEEEGNG